MGLSYTITVGNNSDNVLKVGKTITGGKSKTINPKEIQSIIHPTFIIDYDADLLDANYVTTDFSNYQYFIDDIEINTAGRMVLNCTIDPLSGFDFSNCPITVVRNGGIGEPTKIPDNKLPVKPSTENLYQVPVSNDEFKQLLTYPYVIQVIGG